MPLNYKSPKRKKREKEPKFTFEPSKPYQQISQQPPKKISEIPKQQPQVEKPITKKKGAEGELSYYYIRCNPAKRMPLLVPFQHADFQGFIKISEPLPPPKSTSKTPRK